MKLICPKTKQIPTKTFHARSGLGLGLNLLIMNPDKSNPITILISDIGPIIMKKNIYIYIYIIHFFYIYFQSITSTKFFSTEKFGTNYFFKK